MQNIESLKKRPARAAKEIERRFDIGRAGVALPLQQALVLKDVAHGRKREIAEQAGQPGVSALKIYVVPESRRSPRIFNSRLVRVNFPRMQIEDKLVASLIDASESPARHSIWKQPKVSPARNRQLEPSESRYGDREFNEPITCGRRQ